MAWIEWLKAAILGVIQGITEWLPISSTGHMVLADQWMQLKGPSEFVDLFMVVVQLGSILAVLVLYFHKLNPWAPAKTKGETANLVALEQGGGCRNSNRDCRRAV